MVWLIAASLFFYSLWNPVNLLLLLASILVNYWVSIWIGRSQAAIKSVALTIGIIFNLGLLGYFKYADFLLSTVTALTGTAFDLGKIILPIGISFFTFQQIAYLVDRYREKIPSYSFFEYLTFITCFPYLISGPLLKIDQIIPQYFQPHFSQFNWENLTIGLTMFSIGLFKKMGLADQVAPYANQIFDAAASGTSLTFVEGWLGALAFTLQLYFDFSGYSDMAIGIARMFGLILPANFASPYKAENIVNFWRQWHITLSNFLRDYLYIPLGGNRKGELRRSLNLLITMLLGGLWHGAGWNFVFWGGLHGVYLTVNHGWRTFRQKGLKQDLTQRSKWGVLSSLITFLFVTISWVFFRADSFGTAIAVLKSMTGFNGLSLPEDWADTLGFLQPLGVQFNDLMPNITIEIAGLEEAESIDPIVPLRTVGALLLFVWLMPNTQQWLIQHRPTLSPTPEFTTFGSRIGQLLQWRPNAFWAVFCGILTVAALLNLAKVSEFLYFEF